MVESHLCTISAVRAPLGMNNYERSSEDVPVHTRIEPPLLKLILRLTERRQNLDSSVNNTFLQSSAFLWRCFLAKCNLVTRCFLETSNPVAGLRVFRLASFNRLLTDRSVIFTFLTSGNFIINLKVPVSVYVCSCH